MMSRSKPFVSFSHNKHIRSEFTIRHHHHSASSPLQLLHPRFATTQIGDATSHLIRTGSCDAAAGRGSFNMPSRLFGVDLRLPTPQNDRPYFKTKYSPTSSVTELRKSSIPSMDHIKRPALPSLGKKSDKKDKERSLSKVRPSHIDSRSVQDDRCILLVLALGHACAWEAKVASPETVTRRMLPTILRLILF